MALRANKWTIRAAAVAAIVLCNVVVGCDCGGGSGGGAASGCTQKGYTITDLGSMFPTAINNNSEVIGNVFTSSASTPFVWQNGTMTQIPGLGGSNLVEGLNDTGQIVGTAGGTTFDDQNSHAAIWANSAATPTLLTTPPGIPEMSSDAAAINNNGDIVGFGTRSDISSLSGSDPTMVGHNIVWPHGSTTGVLLPNLPGSDGSALFSVNDSGQAVGAAGFAVDLIKLVSANVSQTTALQDLGVNVTGNTTTHVPTAEIPAFINAGGVVVGSEQTSTGAIVAFMRQANGAVTQLVPQSMGLSGGAGINTAGVVLVDIDPDTPDNNPTTGIFDTTHGYRDLNGLIASCSGWKLQIGRGINDKGQIVGIGTFHGSQHGFLLTPIP